MTMQRKITREVLEDYLCCKTKGFLTLVGQSGTKTDFEMWRSNTASQLAVAANQAGGTSLAVSAYSRSHSRACDPLGSRFKNPISGRRAMFMPRPAQGALACGDPMMAARGLSIADTASSTSASVPGVPLLQPRQSFARRLSFA
jgi:hypothetical protein